LVIPQAAAELSKRKKILYALGLKTQNLLSWLPISKLKLASFDVICPIAISPILLVVVLGYII
jgi:hypothetical protein